MIVEVAFQFIIATIFGLVAYGLGRLFGVPDPWPIIIGVITFLASLGFWVIIIDGEDFS